MQDDPPPPRHLSVVHLCAPADVGGLERVVQGLSSGLATKGHDVSVIAVVEPGSNTHEFFGPMESSGVRCHALEISRRGYLRERREVARLLEEIEPDVLHTHGYRSDLLHGGIARRRGIATITTLHGSSRMGGLSHLFEWAQERALRRFDGVIAVSRPLVDELVRKGVPRERIHLVPNAWKPPENPLSREEARRKLGLPVDGIKIIGWVGRLIHIKGADVFLEALAQLQDDDWVACMIGDGPERSELERMARDLGIEERLFLKGATPQASRFFPAFDLYVLSSRSEGTPMVLLEAMGSGVPVVATDVGGISGMVERDAEAWLVPLGVPSSLSSAIGATLRDVKSSRRRAHSAKLRLQRDFNPQEWLLSHLVAYSNAVLSRRGLSSNTLSPLSPKDGSD